MKKVLILGAGMVVRPMVTYLLENGYQLTVATRTKSKADAMIQGHKNAASRAWTVDDTTGLKELISSHDVTVSLLPWTHHLMVAEECIRQKKNMLTTSYVKPEMQALDAEARQAGIIILNELGLDPGIDHMSAMRIIDHIHNKEGKVEAFYSLCGALPAPEAADNPFGYKFSWSPKGVLMAGNNDGRFLKQKQEVYIPTEDLFKNPLIIDFPNIGTLEVYPNRDSLPYIERYGIPETRTMMRGTFRHPGWCEIIDAMKTMKLFSNDRYDFSGKSYSDMIALLLGENNASSIREKVAKFLGITLDAHALNALDWLGLFSDDTMMRETDSAFEIVSDLMISKMKLKPEERDMVAMQHVFLASYPDGKREVIKSSMLDFGTLTTDTAIARTVALPAAVGVDMICKGNINATGVHIPVIPDIYNPILDALEQMDIRMHEEFGLPESDIIG